MKAIFTIITLLFFSVPLFAQVTGGVVIITGGGSGSATTDASQLTTGTLPVGRLPITGITAGSYGNSTNIPQLNIDQYGRVTGVTMSPITIPSQTTTLVGLDNSSTKYQNDTQVATTVAASMTGVVTPTASTTFSNKSIPAGTGNSVSADALVDGSTNKIPSTGSSFPAVSQGKGFYYSSYVNAPNQTGFVWGPGMYVSNSNRYAPLNLDTHVLTSSGWVGDSWTANYNLSNANQGFVNKVSNYRGWDYTNGGISGSKLVDVAKGTLTTSSEINFIELGINDARTYGSAAVGSYKNLLLSYLLTRQGNVILGQAMTRNTTDWVNANAAYNTGTATKTTVNSSPVSFTVSGDVVYVTMAYDSGGDATYTVTIDGVVQGAYIASSSLLSGYPAPSTASDDVNYYPYTHRFTGLSRNAHNVVITRTGGTSALRILLGSGNGSPVLASGNNNRHTYVLSIGRMTPAGYVTWGGSDAIVAQYNKVLFDCVNDLARDGMQVEFIDIGRYYDPNSPGFVQSDGLHPTDVGTTHIAKAVLEAVNLIDLRRNQFAKNIPSLLDAVTAHTTSLTTLASKSGVNVVTPIATRGFFPNAVETQTGGETAATYRVRYALNSNTVSSRLVYVNSYVPSTAEVSLPGSITISARVQYNGVYIPVYFGGSRTKVIEPGALVQSDPIGASLIPTTSSFIYVDTYVNAGSSPVDVSKLWPISHQLYAGWNEGKTINSDLTSLTSAAPTTANGLGYGPSLITGKTIGQAAVGVVGNSIATGQGDLAPDVSGVNTGQDYGFLRRAFEGANIPYVRVSKPGDKSVEFNDPFGGSIRRSMLEHAGVSIIVDEYGINDVPSGVSLANMKAAATTRWSSFTATGYRVYPTTLTPRVNTTDYVSTTANQSMQTGTGANSVRTQYNDWIRAGADGLIAGYLEIADVFETSRNSGYWKVVSASYSGVVNTATTTTLTVAGTPWTVNNYTGCNVRITSGTGSPQSSSDLPRTIASNTSNTLTLISGQGFVPSLDATTNFSITCDLTIDGTHPSSIGHKLAAQAALLPVTVTPSISVVSTPVFSR